MCEAQQEKCQNLFNVAVTRERYHVLLIARNGVTSMG